MEEKPESIYLEHAQRLGDELLSAFDEVCRKVGVEYILFAGTLLGAVREGGWISWDDDIDVAMTRDQFEIFRADAPRLLPSNMRFSDTRSDRAHITSIPRVLHLDAQRVPFARDRKLQPPETVYLPLDIFVLDEAPPSAARRKLWLKRIRLAEKMVVARNTSLRTALSDKGSSLGRRAIEGAAVLISRVASPSAWRALHTRESARHAGSRTGVLASSNDFKLSARHVPLPVAAIRPAAPIRFEGKDYLGPADAQAVLALMYGPDFMTPPPPEHQKPFHFRNGLILSSGLRIIPD